MTRDQRPADRPAGPAPRARRPPPGRRQRAASGVRQAVAAHEPRGDQFAQSRLHGVRAAGRVARSRSVKNTAPCASSADLRRGRRRRRPVAAAGRRPAAAPATGRGAAAPGTGSAWCGSARSRCARRPATRTQPEELAARQQLVQGGGLEIPEPGRQQARFPGGRRHGKPGQPAEAPSAAPPVREPAPRPAGASAAGSACRRRGSPAPRTAAGSSACSGGCGRAAAGRTTPPRAPGC